MKSLTIVGVTLWVFFAFVGLIGYGLNIVALIHQFTTDGPVTAMTLGRVFGVLVPVFGAVLGWF